MEACVWASSFFFYLYGSLRHPASRALLYYQTAASIEHASLRLKNLPLRQTREDLSSRRNAKILFRLSHRNHATWHSMKSAGVIPSFKRTSKSKSTHVARVHIQLMSLSAHRHIQACLLLQSTYLLFGEAIEVVIRFRGGLAGWRATRTPPVTVLGRSPWF
jgi:hypothetical protein